MSSDSTTLVATLVAVLVTAAFALTARRGMPLYEHGVFRWWLVGGVGVLLFVVTYSVVNLLLYLLAGE